jgi:hypothetical protein
MGIQTLLTTLIEFLIDGAGYLLLVLALGLVSLVLTAVAKNVLVQRFMPFFEDILQTAFDAAISVENGNISQEDYNKAVQRAEKSGRNWKMEYVLMRAEATTRALGGMIYGDGRNPIRALLGVVVPGINIGRIVDAVERYLIDSDYFPDHPKISPPDTEETSTLTLV